MKLDYVPLLQVQLGLQGIPRGMGRFRQFLRTMINRDGTGLELPSLNYTKRTPACFAPSPAPPPPGIMMGTRWGKEPSFTEGGPSWHCLVPHGLRVACSLP
jgi:hypothetical protein